MNELDHPDIHYLSAAVGWIELGNRAEASAELAQVRAEFQSHPDVLEVRWMIQAGDEDWEKALVTAQALVIVAPDRASGWLHQAYAARRAPGGGLEAAWGILLPAAEKFPREETIPYNLSCYACQMKRLDEARTWLRRALEIGDRERVKRMALNDPDLEVLWVEIRAI